MHVAPDDAANVGMPIDDVEELVGILQADTIEPTARHRNRVVVQTDEDVPLRRSGEGRLQSSQALRAEPSGRRAAYRAIEQHDAPEPKINRSSYDERSAVELAAHRLGLIVIAWQAEHRQPESPEQPAEMRVPGRIVLNEIARHEHRIRRPLALLRVGERCLERGQRCNATQQLTLAPVKVRVGEVSQAHYTLGPHHGLRVTESPREAAVN